ncbi:adhesion G protein-coupled receptor A3 [Aplochiton taeniatus]
MRPVSLLCVIVGLWRSCLTSRNCPDLIIDSCHCSVERSKELSRQNVRVKVVCDDVELMDTLQTSFLPNKTVTLILSNNKISLLRNATFYGLAALEKLDLRNNLISTVEDGAFRGLVALKRLDLSNNRIGCFSPHMFVDLGTLSKLNLSGNIFSTLPLGLFSHLPSLRVLHLSTDTLYCDCQLEWLLLWARAKGVRLANDTLCIYPTHLHGLALRNLREQQLRCDGPLELPLFQLIPSQRQVVFQGDRLPLQCAVSYLEPGVELHWRHEGQRVSTREDRGVYLEESLLHDCCMLTSEVVLSDIDVGVAGTWECQVTSSRGNRSRQMEIVVLETSAPYCPADRVNNNKGDFRWPKTLAGILAFVPCAPATFGSAPHLSGRQPPPTPREKKAWRRCDRGGRWAEEDYTQCPYASELTRVLHELTQLTINSSNAQPLGQQLVAFTSRPALFTDVMDVIFVTHLVERLTRLVEQRRDLGDYVSDVASNMMLVEEHVLWMAQDEARACTRIVQCVERIADLALTSDATTVSKVSPNIALEAFLIRPSTFLGLSCAVVERAPPRRLPEGPTGEAERHAVGDTLLNFKCHTVNGSGSPARHPSKNSVEVASIHLPLAGTPIPSALLSVDNSTCKLQFIVFRNGKLFPCTGNSSNLADDGKRRSVSTPVAFTKLDGCSLGSAVQSVTIALRHFALGVDPTAAYWDFDLLDGHGGWRAEGCHIAGSAGNTTTIHCTHHKNFAVLMDLKKVLSFPPYPGEFLHPVVYACTAVMLLCLFASIITYIIHHSTIRISRKGWHMLLNFCFHTALTFAVFAGGINRIKYPIICQAVGVVLHYSSLSTMLWLGVTARNIYTQVTKKPRQPTQGQAGEPPAPPVASKQPLLRFYFISGGVPLLICGVTAAVDLDNYGSVEQAPYCWMAWEPSLGAFYGPVAFIVLVTCVYFLCTFLQLRRHPEKKYELKRPTEEQSRLAAVDVPPHCPQGEPGALAPAPAGGHCHAGCPGIPINPALLANEHSFRAQLRTAAFTLFLFLATWTLGALAVSQGHFLDMIFSCLYGAFSVTLGLFVLIHHCAKRDDVWHCWCSCCPGRHGHACGAHARPKVTVNGDTPGHGHAHCHLDSPCPGKAPMGCGHAAAAVHNHGACLGPVAPCCAALHSQQLMEEEPPPAAHVLLHADPEGYRPGVHLHRCLKGSARTKGRSFSRGRAAGPGGVPGGEREYTYHLPSSGDGGSVHSSHTGSPHSTHERHAHACPHLAHEGHLEGRHVCRGASAHGALACHNPCHRHICCAKADFFPALCPAEAGDAGTFLCGCGKMAEEDLMVPHHHMELHPQPRRQSFPQNLPNQNGILKGGLHEGFLYASDSTGNVRTGPWRNETTV